jgi:predicted amidohydrolase
MKLGLFVAKKELGKINELKRFLEEGKKLDALLSPEGYLHSDRILDAQQLAKKHQKWLFLGVEEFTQQGHFESAIVIDRKGKIIGKHRKTVLTRSEIEEKKKIGNDLNFFKTEFGKVGIAVCFEIYFPEICRVFTLNGVKLILNPIGTGMWHERQFQLWNAVGMARADEDQVYVAGVSHFCDKIPIAYAYAPDGKLLAQSRNKNELVVVNLNLKSKELESSRLAKRKPHLYSIICKTRVSKTKKK